jgi:hypothetical protein
MGPISKFKGEPWKPTLASIPEEGEKSPPLVNKPIQKLKEEEKQVNKVIEEARKRSKSI